MTSEQEPFQTAYRQVFGNDFASWDSPVMQRVMGAHRERFALDTMYVPLRLAQGQDSKNLERGAILEPPALATWKKPLLVFGPPGSGKTTWVRYTFRRLVRDPAVLPWMLVAHDLASRQELGENGLVKFLEAEMGQRLGSSLPANRWSLEAILAAPSGPRPILLVDGWAELGSLGAEIRAQTQALMKRFPRLLVVATCRSGARPSHSELFTVRDLQPLDSHEIAALSQHFLDQLGGTQGDRARASWASLQQFFSRSAAARELASNPLLLTALLVLHSVQDLPERRHVLDEACIRLLLGHPLDPQAPFELGRAEPAAPLSVLAQLAYDLQAAGYSQKDRRVLRQNQNELMRRYALEGLRAGKEAGLLWEQEGNLGFTFLPFQEYLAARHLHLDQTSESRLVPLAAEPNWWETLRLWAALAQDEDPTKGADQVAQLLSGPGLEPRCLAGLFWADGLGYDDQLTRVGQALVQVLETESFGLERKVAQSFAAGSAARRRAMLELFDHTASTRGWLMWQRLAAFVRHVDPHWTLAKPRRPNHRLITQQILGESLPWAAGAAAARVLAGSYPLWPLVPTSWALLQLWPNSRRTLGARLQHAQTAAEAATTRTLEAAWLTPRDPTSRGATLELALELAREWALDLDHDLARNFARDLARDFPGDLEQEPVRAWARDWARDWEIELQPFWPADLAQELGRAWAHELARESARRHGLVPEPDLLDLLAYERLAFGRSGARALLASFPDPSDDPRWRLLRAACQLSCNPNDPVDAFQVALEENGPACEDPLWPALAKFLGRRANPDDRHLLQEALLHPELRPEPLRSGLQFIARGDVLLEDGSAKNLDAFCDERGLPHLPLLEDLPDELDLGADWDEDL